MSEVKHTPGPWAVKPPWNGFSAIYGPDHRLVFGIAAGDAGERRGEAECEANARLIAAAPELLAIAKLVLSVDDEWKALSIDERSRVEAVVAKAEAAA